MIQGNRFAHLIEFDNVDTMADVNGGVGIGVKNSLPHMKLGSSEWPLLVDKIYYYATSQPNSEHPGDPITSPVIIDLIAHGVIGAGKVINEGAYRIRIEMLLHAFHNVFVNPVNHYCVLADNRVIDFTVYVHEDGNKYYTSEVKTTYSGVYAKYKTPYELEIEEVTKDDSVLISVSGTNVNVEVNIDFGLAGITVPYYMRYKIHSDYLLTTMTTEE